MEIPKDAVLKLIREKAGAQQADEAAGQLPDKVDPEKHADLLSRFGIDPKELLGGAGGIGGLGDKIGL